MTGPPPHPLRPAPNPPSPDVPHRKLKPKTARFQEKRDTILAAAAERFNDLGVKGATLSDIAASVGLVTTSITYYYRKKEDLATACFLRAIEARRALVAQAAQASHVAGRIAAYLQLHAGLLAGIASGEQPALILFNDIRALPDAQAEQVYAAYNDMFRQLRGLLTGTDSALRAREAMNARTHLLLSVVNAMPAWIGRYEADEYPRVAQRISDLLLHGLPANGQSWPDAGQLAALGLPEPAPAGDATADTFLRAATELVNEQGYRGASVDRISARLKLTKGAFYHHHDTKLDVISACFERGFAVQRHVLKAAETAAGPGWQRSCAATTMLLRWQLSDQGPMLRSTAISALPDRSHREQVQRTMLRLTERIASVLVDGLVDGSVRAQDLSVAAYVLASAINAAAELRRWVAGITPDSVAQLYARPALLGLLCAD